jgi:hypothetical protein
MHELNSKENQKKTKEKWLPIHFTVPMNFRGRRAMEPSFTLMFWGPQVADFSEVTPGEAILFYNSVNYF